MQENNQNSAHEVLVVTQTTTMTATSTTTTCNEQHSENDSSKNEKENQATKEIENKTTKEAVAQKPCEKWKLSDFFVGRRLGVGSFGKVYLAKEKKTNFVLALKIMLKSDVKRFEMETQLEREVEIQSHLLHPNILRLYSVFYDNANIYIMLEHAQRGEVFADLRLFKRYCPTRSATFIEQVTNALKYFHSFKVIHRDLKPENLLLSRDGAIKVADFGWSVHTPSSKRNTFCGTVDYLAPEMVKRRMHDHRVDIWAVGILTYEFLTGSPPFQSTNQYEKMKLIEKCEIKYPSKMNLMAKDFISKILLPHPERRLTPEQIINHPWIQQNSEHTLDRCSAAVEAWKLLDEKKASLQQGK